MSKYMIGLIVMLCSPIFMACASEDVVGTEEIVVSNAVKPEILIKTKKAKKYHKRSHSSVVNNFYYIQNGQCASNCGNAKQMPIEHDYAKSYNRDSVNNKDNVNKDYPKISNNVSNNNIKERKAINENRRKYFLAHPFFQPLQGHFGSITDFNYAKDSFNFDILNASVRDWDKNNTATYDTVIAAGNVSLSGKTEDTQFSVKEDISFGLTDTLAIIGMIQYDYTKTQYKDWSSGDPTDKYSDSGIDVFGFGLQERFVDRDDWIAMISGYYMHQKNTANTFSGELKVGYKIYNTTTTLYGLLRGTYSDLTDGNMYGSYVQNGSGDWLMLSYNDNVNNVGFVEGGIGAFGVVSRYFTLNGELVYGNYDWHNQLNIKGAVGFQPNDMFALNMYVSASLYDSADNKNRRYVQYDVNPVLPSQITSSVVYIQGDYKIKNYNEYKLGLQAILYF